MEKSVVSFAFKPMFNLGTKGWFSSLQEFQVVEVSWSYGLHVCVLNSYIET